MASSEMMKPRRADQRDGDDDALRHAAGQLVRIGVQPPIRIGDVHGPQHVERQRLGRAPVDAEMGHGDVGDLLADRQQRVELAARIGHDHGHVRARAATRSSSSDRRGEIPPGEI